MRELSTEKSGLHVRNPHRFRYNFDELMQSCNDLKSFVFTNPYQSQTIDFANPDAVKMLNRAILKHFYGINYWEIPPKYLCPPIPGRADYLHYIADLLALSNNGIVPKGQSVKIMDIGVGANCVYPIIGNSVYGWHFLGSDIDPIALENAREIIHKNPSLSGNIELRFQPSAVNIFKGIITEDEVFDVSICNPPFHTSLEEAIKGTRRKIKNLTGQKLKSPKLNFGGQPTELYCEGGEEAFVKQMIEESSIIPKKCIWFTSLISKKEHLPSIYKMLKTVKVVEFKTIEMAQGQKMSRIIAWTFWNKRERANKITGDFQ